MRFRSVEEELIEILEDGRCQMAPESYAQPGGRFAWLPNHEYEISFRTRLKTRHERIGELVQEVPQRLLFHTKGLPGLNQVERIGEEFEPYVESAYPGPGRLLYRNEPVALALNERSEIFRRSETPSPDDPLERRQQVDWVMVVSRVGGSGPAERVSRPDSDWIVAHRGTVAPPSTGHLPADVFNVADVSLRRALSLDPLWQRFELVLGSPSSCDQSPSPPPSRVLLHRPYDPAQPDAAPPLWPPRAVLRAGVQIRRGPHVERAPFVAGDETALLTTGGIAWSVADGAVGPTTDTGTSISLAIFGEASWRHFQLSATINPRGGTAGVAAAVKGTPQGSMSLLFVVDEQANRLRVIRPEPGGETELGGTALPPGLRAPFVLDLIAYDDAWHVSVGTAQLKIPREFKDSGRLALAVRGLGQILDLRVDPLDNYRFDFLTSRYVDFAQHIASWPGTIALLPEVAPPGTTLADLLSATPLTELMRAGSDPQQRQYVFNEWTRIQAVSLRRGVERLEVSGRSTPNGCDLLLLESPEPLPFSEDVEITMSQIQAGSVRIPVPVAILSDGAESRAYLIPLSNQGQPIELSSGEYEIAWSISRDRFRSNASDPDSSFSQQTTMSLHI
jgi:hypothetical protein